VRLPWVWQTKINEIVRKFIDMYAGRLRNQVSFMLSACNFYMWQTKIIKSGGNSLLISSFLFVQSSWVKI